MKDLFRIVGIIISIAVMLASCGGSDSTSSSGAAVTTFAGKAGSSGSADGTGTAALFNSPSAITTDGTNLYVTDSGNNTIRKIVIATGAVAIFSGSASGDSGSTDGIGTAALFNRPSGITTDGTNLYVTDSGNHIIRKIVIATGEVTTLAGTAGSSGSVDGTGTGALFNNPLGVASDINDVYVADSGNNTIRKIVIATGEVTTLAGTAGSSGSADGTGTAAFFNNPADIASDGTNLYIADSGNNTIRKIVIATGEVTTLAGTAGSPGSADGTGTGALFNNPLGVASDVNDVYVTDSGNNTIRKIVIATGAVTTLAGTAGSSGSIDGTGTAALFNNPADIAYDGTNLYVADSGNHTIRKIVIATGEVTTLAGTAGSFGSANGTGAAALFNNPLGIATDRTNLYIADSGNNTIRKIVIATGVVTTFAGKAGSSGSADGTGTAALFNNPVGVATVGAVLYVGDTGNNTIRKIN